MTTTQRSSFTMPPTNNSVETLSDNFNPHQELLGLERCISPTSSIRGCYVRSRPTSYLDDGDHMQGQLNFSALGATLNNLTGGQDDHEETPPPHRARNSRLNSVKSHRSFRGCKGGPQYDVDTVSVITTRTTVSFHAVRNPEATPPMLRQSERGKKFSRSTGDLLSNVNESRDRTKLEVLKEKEGSKGKTGGWKGGKMLKEKLSLLFSGRKGNAGILDRDGGGHKEAQERKKSFSFRRAPKVVEGSDVKDSLELEHTRSSKTSVLTRRRTRTKGNYIELQEMPEAHDQRIHHAKSFAGFRGTTINDAPPVPKIPDMMNDVAREEELIDDAIDEITREAAQVNKGVRRNYSYEEDHRDHGGDHDEEDVE